MLKKFLQDKSVKNHTSKFIYRLIHQSGPVSKADVTKLSELPQTTLTRLLDEMIMKGLIKEAGFGKSSGGRPPLMYKVISDATYMIGIDISRRQTRVVLVDATLSAVDHQVIELTLDRHPSAAIFAIKGAVRELTQTYGIQPDDLLGIGIGAVGPLNREEGLILNHRSASIGSWSRIEIIRELKKDFPTDIVLENGANTAALAEFSKNRIENENLLYCISGIGLRCGIITNGRLIQNKTGNVSSQGHMIIDPRGKECSCGKKGCWVVYTSLLSLLDETRRRKNRGTDYDLPAFMDSLKERDPAAEQAVQDSSLYFGIGLSNMINMFHPESVIIDSPLFNVYPDYFDDVARAASEHLTSFGDSEMRFSRGILKEQAASIGAAHLLFDSYFIDY